MYPNFPNFIGMSKQSPPKWCPSAKIVPNKIAKKQYLLRFFLELFGYKTFDKIYLIRTEILSVEQSKTRNGHGSGTQIGRKGPHLSFCEEAGGSPPDPDI
jgi:hypothetical protein